MAVLETDRLTMRPLTGDDFADYAAMLADPQVAGGLAESTSTSPDDAWRSLAMFIGHREIRGYSHWALKTKPGNGSQSEISCPELDTSAERVHFMAKFDQLGARDLKARRA